MQKGIIAVPSTAPGGLEAGVNEHFGHCDAYTLVEVDGGEIVSSQVLPSLPHGNCLAPVQFLAEKGVGILISGGMGMRPLAGFQQNGIEVYYGKGLASVKDAVALLIKGELPVFPPAAACGGGGGCGGH